MEQGTTTHFVELENCIVVIKNVPCEKCSQCGEVVYSGATIKELEKITNRLKNSLTEIAVVQFSNAA